MPNYQITKLKEFQSLENDVCHTVIFGNIAIVVALCKMLHWMQMVDGSKCVLNTKNVVFHMTFGKYQNLGTSENFLEFFFLSEFVLVFFHRIFFDKNVFPDNFFQRIFHCF